MEPVKDGTGARLSVECPRCGYEQELAVLVAENVSEETDEEQG